MDWKLRKTDERHAGTFTLLYKLYLKAAANAGQTDRHTQSEYYNPLAHARRALIMCE